MSRKATSTDNGRDEGGKFAVGNPGGPGRPCRPTERVYLTALADRVPPERWARICERAATDAENGDPAARAWLTRYLVGVSPLSLGELAKLEVLGVDAQAEVLASAEQEADPNSIDNLLAGLGQPSQIKRAMRLAAQRGNHE